MQLRSPNLSLGSSVKSNATEINKQTDNAQSAQKTPDNQVSERVNGDGTPLPTLFCENKAPLTMGDRFFHAVRDLLANVIPGMKTSQEIDMGKMMAQAMSQVTYLVGLNNTEGHKKIVNIFKKHQAYFNGWETSPTKKKHFEDFVRLAKSCGVLPSKYISELSKSTSKRDRNLYNLAYEAAGMSREDEIIHEFSVAQEQNPAITIIEFMAKNQTVSNDELFAAVDNLEENDKKNHSLVTAFNESSSKSLKEGYTIFKGNSLVSRFQNGKTLDLGLLRRICKYPTNNKNLVYIVGGLGKKSLQLMTRLQFQLQNELNKAENKDLKDMLTASENEAKAKTTKDVTDKTAEDEPNPSAQQPGESDQAYALRCQRDREANNYR